MPFGVINVGACFQRAIDEILNVKGIKDTLAYINKATV